jgi:hypothetical protein
VQDRDVQKLLQVEKGMERMWKPILSALLGSAVTPPRGRVINLVKRPEPTEARRGHVEERSNHHQKDNRAKPEGNRRTPKDRLEAQVEKRMLDDGDNERKPRLAYPLSPAR